MRYIALLLYVLLALVLFLVVYVVALPTIYNIYIMTSALSENMSANFNSTINASQYNVLSAITPWLHILDIALAITIIAVIIALFIYSRKR